MLYRIVTCNNMDALYIVSTPENVHDNVIHVMRARFDRRNPDMVEAIEDMTSKLEGE